MYTDGQVLGASTVTGAGIATLPLTAGNTVLEILLIAAIAMASAVLAVRIIKLSIINKS